MRCSSRTASKNFIFRIAESKKDGRALLGMSSRSGDTSRLRERFSNDYARHEWISEEMASEDWIIAAKYCRAFREIRDRRQLIR
jgi:hypothetical protein